LELESSRGTAASLIFKCNADEIAFTPDQATLADGKEIIKGQFEADRHHHEILRAKAGANVGYVNNAARTHANLPAEQEQRAFVDPVSLDRSAIIHRGHSHIDVRRTSYISIAVHGNVAIPVRELGDLKSTAAEISLSTRARHWPWQLSDQGQSSNIVLSIGNHVSAPPGRSGRC
jgi:hypothetical protein